MFSSIFVEIDWKLIFLVYKVTLRKKFRITQKIIFHKWIVGNPEEMFWFDWNNLFWSNQWNGTNIEEYIFPPQNEPHTAKLNFSGVFKNFCRKWCKLHFLVYLRKKLKNTHKCILQVWKAENPKEYFYMMETTFFVKPVKWDKYKKNFFLLKMSHIQLI